MFDEEVVPAHEQVLRRALGDVVVDVVGVDEQAAVLAGEQVGGAVRVNSVAIVNDAARSAHGRGGLAVHVLVGGDDHWLAAGQCAGAGHHRRERAERDVRRPRLDVHGVLGERGGAPRSGSR